MATRATIRALARVRADQTNSTFPTDAEYNTLIDACASRVWRKLVKAGWRPARTTVSITATGAASYAVGTNVSLILAVNRVEGTQHSKLSRLKQEDYASYLSMPAGPGLVYDLVNGVVATQAIEFYPRPSTGTYEVIYISRFAGFAADGDTWIGPDGSDELVALDAAIMGLGKEGDPATQLRDDYATAYAAICEQADWLDATQQQVVRDVRDSSQIDPFSYGISEGWV